MSSKLSICPSALSATLLVKSVIKEELVDWALSVVRSSRAPLTSETRELVMLKTTSKPMPFKIFSVIVFIAFLNFLILLFHGYK